MGEEFRREGVHCRGDDSSGWLVVVVLVVVAECDGW